MINWRKFITAGKATITVESKNTGKWYTYDITKSKKFEYVYFISTASVYLGHLNSNTWVVKAHTEAIKDYKSFKAFAYTIKHLDDLKGIVLRHEGRCGRCGIALTTPESIDSGFGPICRKEIGV
jgi:hypothetical protein